MKITKITNKGITFDNGVVIQDHHDQDCCEQVYADFMALVDTTIFDEDFKKLDVKLVEFGVSLNNYFIPCYNIQNGYYSNKLEIVVKYPATKDSPVREERIDVTGHTKYDIDD